jgi:DNA-binding CsgD family transcriptional regulator
MPQQSEIVSVMRDPVGDEGAAHTLLSQIRDGTLRSWLLERDEELARIEQAVTDLERGCGGVLIIQGAAGIGKTTLLRVVCAHAEGRGLATLTARASELEQEFGFGVVRQLLERRVVRADEDNRVELLAGAAALAGPVLGLGGGAGDPFATLHGLYWLLANLTVDAPVVMVIDDLQWADELSLRWLIYLCHRLEGLPVLIAATTRQPRPKGSPLLAELLAMHGAQLACPSPLSELAVVQLLHQRLGAPPEPTFATVCVKVSGGNPFMLHELISDLLADGVAPVAAQAAGVAERVPAQVGRVVLARLERLDESAVRLAGAVAVLGEGTGLRQAATFAELSLDTAAAAADALRAADLLTEAQCLRFVHPLVRSAVYEQLAPGARTQAHARAARLLASENAEPEQVAMQLLSCEPMGNADAVQTLRAAASTALERGAPETAITYLSRALAEPPAEAVRAALLAELGEVEKITLHPAAAAHLDQAWQATTDPVARARLADQLASVLIYTADLTGASVILRAGLAGLGDRDPDLAARLGAHQAAVEIISARPVEAPEVTLRQLRELASRDLPASRFAQLVLAHFLVSYSESCDEVAGLVERGLGDGRLIAEETSEAIPVVWALWALIFIDELDAARVLAEAMQANAQARGSVLGYLNATGRRGIAALRRGALAQAEADTLGVLELATEHHLALSVPLYAVHLGMTLLERGQLDQAAEVLDKITMPTTTILTGFLLEARARLHLARGQHAQAIAELRHCGQLVDHTTSRNPNIVAWRSTLALALASEHSHEARELAHTELQLARRCGSSRAIGIALRVCGLLTDAQHRIEYLEQSVAVLSLSPARLELAHSLTELGAALRRAGARTAAREPLRQALHLAHHCGATPLAERAREEALAVGARPRRPWTTGMNALTPSELRVARLAAQSLSNRDIAQALFITTKTVSDHLTSAYRKLNISSRNQLANAIIAQSPPENL